MTLLKIFENGTAEFQLAALNFCYTNFLNEAKYSKNGPSNIYVQAALQKFEFIVSV